MQVGPGEVAWGQLVPRHLGQPVAVPLEGGEGCLTAAVPRDRVGLDGGTWEFRREQACAEVGKGDREGSRAATEAPSPCWHIVGAQGICVLCPLQKQ